ncbi:MAG: autotransporter domain-containing protein [Pseudomonadota bacterium]
MRRGRNNRVRGKLMSASRSSTMLTVLWVGAGASGLEPHRAAAMTTPINSFLSADALIAGAQAGETAVTVCVPNAGSSLGGILQVTFTNAGGGVVSVVNSTTECALDTGGGDTDDGDAGIGNQDEEDPEIVEDGAPEIVEEDEPEDAEEEAPDMGENDADADNAAEIAAQEAFVQDRIAQLLGFATEVVPGARNPNAFAQLGIQLGLPLQIGGAPALFRGGAGNAAKQKACFDELADLNDRFDEFGAFIEKLQAEKLKLADLKQLNARETLSDEDKKKIDEFVREQLQGQKDFEQAVGQLEDAELEIQAFQNALGSITARLEAKRATLADLKSKNNENLALTEENARKTGDPELIALGRGNDDRVAGIESAFARDLVIQAALFAGGQALGPIVGRVLANSARGSKLLVRGGALRDHLGTSKEIAEDVGGVLQRTIERLKRGPTVGETIRDGRRAAANKNLQVQRLKEQVRIKGRDKLEEFKPSKKPDQLKDEALLLEDVGAPFQQELLKEITDTLAANQALLGSAETVGTKGSQLAGNSAGKEFLAGGEAARAKDPSALEATFNFLVDFLGFDAIVAGIEEKVFGGRFTLGRVLSKQIDLFRTQQSALIDALESANFTADTIRDALLDRAVQQARNSLDEQIAEANTERERLAEEIARKEIECEKLGGLPGRDFADGGAPAAGAAGFGKRHPLEGATKIRLDLGDIRNAFAQSGAVAGSGGVFFDDRLNLWISPGVTYHNDQSADDVEGVSYSFGTGASWQLFPNHTIGITGQYVRSDLDSNPLNQIEANTFTVGVFSQSALPHDITLSALAAYTFSDTRIDNDGIRGSTDTNAFTAQIDVSRSFLAGNWSFTPGVSGTYVHIDQDGFSDSIGLENPSSTIDQFALSFGGTVAREFVLMDGDLALIPSLGANGFWASSEIDNEVLPGAGRDSDFGLSVSGGLSVAERQSGLRASLSGVFGGLTGDQQTFSIFGQVSLPFR